MEKPEQTNLIAGGGAGLGAGALYNGERKRFKGGGHALLAGGEGGTHKHTHTRVAKKEEDTGC